MNKPFFQKVENELKIDMVRRSVASSFTYVLFSTGFLIYGVHHYGILSAFCFLAICLLVPSLARFLLAKNITKKGIQPNSSLFKIHRTLVFLNCSMWAVFLFYCYKNVELNSPVSSIVFFVNTAILLGTISSLSSDPKLQKFFFLCVTFSPVISIGDRALTENLPQAYYANCLLLLLGLLYCLAQSKQYYVHLIQRLEGQFLIEFQNNQLRSIFSALPEAVFSFDGTGEISADRSSQANAWFNSFEDCSTIFQFMNKYAQQSLEKTENLLSLIWEPNILADSETVFNLWPDSFKVLTNNLLSTYTLSYSAQFNNDKKIEKVIVIAKDITSKVKADEQQKLESYRMTRLLNAVSYGFDNCRTEFGRHMKDVSHQMPPTELKRKLHTLKGALAVFGFIECSDKIHHLESLITRESKSFKEWFQQEWEDFETLFQNQIDDLSQLLRINVDQSSVRINRHKFELIKNRAFAMGDSEMQRMIESTDAISLVEVFGKYQNYVKQLEGRFAGKAIRIQFDDHSAEIPRTLATELDTSMIHLIRNSIDHGLEEGWQRKALGKDPVGTIRISAFKNSDNDYTFVIEDDGQGIDLDHLRKKLVQKGMVGESEATALSEQQLYAFLFRQEFTTKDEVSDLSGRGVGLDSVMSHVQSVGGKVVLESRKGHGTRFTLTLPLRASLPRLQAA